MWGEAFAAAVACLVEPQILRPVREAATEGAADAEVDGDGARAFAVVARDERRAYSRIDIKGSKGRDPYIFRSGRGRDERRAIIEDSVAVVIAARDDVEESPCGRDDERAQGQTEPLDGEVATDESSVAREEGHATEVTVEVIAVRREAST